jgi:LacI family transcriptional regulator
VVCGNDVIALGVLSAARRLGIDVPGELTVVGIDDFLMAGSSLVDLTKVHCDLPALAAEAVTSLAAERDETGQPPVVRRVARRCACAEPTIRPARRAQVASDAADGP